MLTDRAKIDFEDWLNYELIKIAIFEVVDFYELPLSMQWGVYVDFFDSNEIKVEVSREVKDILRGGVYYVSNGNDYIGAWETLDEARRAAIKDANRFFNNGNEIK